MNRVVKAIFHFVKHSSVWVSQQFEKLVGSDAAHAFAVAAESVLHSQMGKIAQTVVTELAALKLPGDQKRAEAFRKILAAAESSGVFIADSEINLLIEVAVSALKQKFGPGDAPAVN